MESDYVNYNPLEKSTDINELFVESLELKFNKEYNDDIKMNGKILYDTEKLNLHFDILLYDNSEINPTDDEIELNIDFIEDEIPYIQIISNLLTPTLYDIKNYFFCLSSNTTYIFKRTKLDKCQLIFEEIFSNIKLFLYNIRESQALKTYIYFGEYNTNHIYHINNFLRNSERINFFRINRIKNNIFYDKMLYIICTELYIILFEPIENNKSLGKILFYNKLSETKFHFEEIGISYDKKEEPKKRLKIILYDSNNKILYRESNEELQSNKVIITKLYNDKNNSIDKNEFNHYSENIIKKDSFKNRKRNSKTNIEEVKKNTINIKENISYDTKNIFEFIFINKKEYVDDAILLQNEYISFKKIISKKNIIDDIGYKCIITYYRLLFGQSIKQYERKTYIKKTKEEFDNIIEYNEKLYDKYKNIKTEFSKKRIKYIINNLIFLCTKISGLLYDDETINFYLNKMRKYAELI